MSAQSGLKLYGYFRSSAVYRVRIALGLKGLDADLEFIHLRKGDQHSDSFKAINPQQLIPALQTPTGAVLNQSQAIIEWLDETYPEPALLPGDALDRADVRAVAATVACDIHPLANLRVLGYLKNELGLDDGTAEQWSRHWVKLGLDAVEAKIATTAGRYCFGDVITMADVFVVPQVANARRVDLDLSGYENILKVEQACFEHDAFQAAKPENQPDAE